MNLSIKEKERRKRDRKQVAYEETHISVNGVILKWCTYDEHWIEMNDENFYKSKENHIDGYMPYCKACTSKKSYKWQVENRERTKLSQKRFNAKNYKDLSKYTKTRRLNGKYKKWQQDNPEKIKGYAVDRGNKKHTISKQEWKDCNTYFNDSCAYCGLPIEDYFTTYRGVTKNGNFHKEHVNHLGANDLSNCVPSCKICNSSKRTKELEEWYKSETFFSQDKLDKIHKWLTEDYKLYIKEKKQK